MIAVVAVSSSIFKIELKLGIERLENAGFRVKVHPNAKKTHRHFAGTDEERAEAFFEAAFDPECDIVWCARGGYGAARLLPILERLERERGAPRPGKLFVGYSDATALFDYVRREWGWSVLHAPMPGLRSFFRLSRQEWTALLSWLGRKSPASPFGRAKLQHVGGAAAREELSGELVGGNLATWSAFAGTPYLPSAQGKFVFFEEIAEHPYRIDRMVTQLDQAGGFEGALAVVLGDFLDCEDHVSLCLVSTPKRGFRDPALKTEKTRLKLKPARKRLDAGRAIREIFSEVGARRGFPVFAGLPVGHGPGHFSLPVGARYRLGAAGVLQLESWNWLRPSE